MQHTRSLVIDHIIFTLSPLFYSNSYAATDDLPWDDTERLGGFEAHYFAPKCKAQAPSIAIHDVLQNLELFDVTYPRVCDSLQSCTEFQTVVRGASISDTRTLLLTSIVNCTRGRWHRSGLSHTYDPLSIHVITSIFSTFQRSSFIMLYAFILRKALESARPSAGNCHFFRSTGLVRRPVTTSAPLIRTVDPKKPCMH